MKQSIMPEYEKWSTQPFSGLHKHHIFGGANRSLSEKDGLFVFLPPELHNMSDKGIHFDKEFMQYAHDRGREAWMKYYNKTEEDFIARYGRSYRDWEE